MLVGSSEHQILGIDFQVDFQSLIAELFLLIYTSTSNLLSTSSLCLRSIFTRFHLDSLNQSKASSPEPLVVQFENFDRFSPTYPK